jgi:hypothetical protein
MQRAAVMVLRLQHIERERSDDALPPIADPDDIGHQRLAPIPVAPLRRRPSTYRADYPQMALGYCLLGATNRQLAELFNVTPQTVDNWMNAHSEFAEAIEEGRTKADLFVAQSLYRRACGYTERIRTVVRETRTVPGKEPIVVERETETAVHVPADPTAAARWLHLRQNLHDPERNTLTVDDIIRIAEMARAEAARRGIDYTAAIDGTAEDLR